VNATPSTTQRPDWAVLVAVACVACSWFLMSSLNTNLGVVQLQFRFYNVLTLMHSPRSIITGAEGDRAALDAWIFGAVCMVAILAALAPLVSRRRIAWLGCLAPFALMALTGAILYHGFSQDLIADKGTFGDTGSQFIRFANSLASRVGDAITRQIHVGPGGYLALIATAFLAIKGLRGYQQTPHSPPGTTTL
jgi:hypothetical protein